MKSTFALLIIALFFMGLKQAQSQMVVTYRAPESATDQRYDYERELLELLLTKTEDEYGSFELRPSPVMNFSRALEELRAGNIPNLVIKTSATDEYLENFDYMPVPVARGIFGYRVFFTNPRVATDLANVSGVEELQQFTMGQGTGWVDARILTHNGFEVNEVSSFDSMFRMVAANRFNLFPRGANEILTEYDNHGSMNNLVLDENLILFYPLPRFLFTTPGNTELMERLEAGFYIAHEDGSFNTLWEDYFMESIEFVDLDNRTLIEIENPLIQSLDLSTFEQYRYNPFSN